jgi:hypothetical protein
MIIQGCNVSVSQRDHDHGDNGKRRDIILWLVGIKLAVKWRACIACQQRRRGIDSQHEVWAGPRDLCFFLWFGGYLQKYV